MAAARAETAGRAAPQVSRGALGAGGAWGSQASHPRCYRVRTT